MPAVTVFGRVFYYLAMNVILFHKHNLRSPGKHAPNKIMMFNTTGQGWIWMATEKPHLKYCSDILNDLVDEVVERYSEADNLYVRGEYDATLI